jgi:hypothetical protein
VGCGKKREYGTDLLGLPTYPGGFGVGGSCEDIIRIFLSELGVETNGFD